jgi:hypothetical protein
MFFHGWGGSAQDCGSVCTDAKKKGFITMSMTGMGAPNDWNSWNGFGSTKSPGPDGKTCNNHNEDNCYEDCGGCADECWWTTCKDSVQQTVEVLQFVLTNFCVDMSMIWATGCRNGGMFLYELAQDPRTNHLLAGVAPMVGLPHNGFNLGPASPMHFIGNWGVKDDCVPAIANLADDGSFDP